jgi:hypothetical protein
MTNFAETLTLSTTNLRERRSQLESELNKVVVEIVVTEVKESISKAISEEFAEQKPDIARLSWDFYPESDDEGGSDWWVTDVSAYDSEGEYVELGDFSYEQLSWNKEYTYQVGLDEAVREILSDFRDDLYSQYITELFI